MHLADCPRASTSRFFSSSATSTSVVPSPAISNRTWPGCTRSPGSAWRVSTVPATSARIVALSSCAWALASRAWALASWAWPGLQCARLQLGLFGGQAGQGFGLYGLFQRFVADGLLAGQQAAALEFTAGLLPLLLCLLRGPLGLWAGGLLQLGQGSTGLAHLGLRSSARSTASTSPGRTRSPSRTCRCSTTPVMGLPTCTRAGAVSPPRGHHGLHQGLGHHLVGRQPGAGHFLGPNPTQGQRQQRGTARLSKESDVASILPVLWWQTVYWAVHCSGTMRPISTVRSSPLPRMVWGPLL